ncbi:MAG: DUF3618 domain-containing protein [Rubrobacter sp.]|nr:DUF3618 domain-containing protein [Rubrobacter sp.]
MDVGMSERLAPKVLTWAGAYIISFVGLIHLIESDEHFEVASYLGWLFLANFAGAAVAAVGIYWGGHRWGWLLGDAVAGGAFVLYVVSRVIGLPGFHPEDVWEWVRIDGLLSLGLESLFMMLSLLAITPQGRALVRMEQERIEEEQTVSGETPGRIEQEMLEIRRRMAPDLSDLREHIEPQAIREQAKRSLQERLRGIFNGVKPTRRRQA